MENPATWKRAEKVIMDAEAQWYRWHKAGAVGLSRPAFIAHCLREAGLLHDENEPALGWEGLRRSYEEPDTGQPGMAVCSKDVNLRHPVGQCPYCGSPEVRQSDN